MVIDESINLIINECSKLVQKEYKTRHDWMGKAIHWELYKKLKFDLRTNEHAQPSICPGEWEAQTPLEFRDTNISPNLNQTTRPCDSQQKKKKENPPNCGLCCSGWPLSNIEKKLRIKISTWTLRKIRINIGIWKSRWNQL